MVSKNVHVYTILYTPVGGLSKPPLTYAVGNLYYFGVTKLLTSALSNFKKIIRLVCTLSCGRCQATLGYLWATLGYSGATLESTRKFSQKLSHGYPGPP